MFVLSKTTANWVPIDPIVFEYTVIALYVLFMISSYPPRIVERNKSV